MKTACKKLFSVSIIALTITILTQGCAVIRPDIDLKTITPADEETYAKAVNPFVLQRLGAKIPDEEIQTALSSVAARLQTGKQKPVFFVVNDPVPAAFALPGGGIVVTRGLLFHVESEVELLVLLAHLLGHDASRDAILLAARTSTQQKMLLPLSDYDAAAVSSKFLTEPFSNTQEIAADRYAAELFASAGHDPTLYLSLLPKIYARLEALPDFQPQSMTKQHPLSTKRLKAAEDSVAALSSSPADPVKINSFSFEHLSSVLLATRPGYVMYQEALQLEKKGVTDQAIGMYLKAATTAPDQALLLTGLGLAYMRQDAFVAARQHLTRAMRLDSTYYHARLGLGYLYLQEKKFNEAEEHLIRSQTLLPTSLGGYLLARYYDDIGDTKTALSLYREVVHYFKESQMGKLAAKRILELAHELE